MRSIAPPLAALGAAVGLGVSVLRDDGHAGLDVAVGMLAGTLLGGLADLLEER